jgi:hypothetical protein
VATNGSTGTWLRGAELAVLLTASGFVLGMLWDQGKVDADHEARIIALEHRADQARDVILRQFEIIDRKLDELRGKPRNGAGQP